MPFLIGGVLVYVLLSRQRSPRLAYAGGILLGCGMVGLSMIQGFETLAFGLTEDGRFDLKALPDKVDNLTVALGSRTRGAVVLLPIFLVVDIALQQGLPGHLIALVAAVWIASAVLRARLAVSETASAGS